MTNILKRTKIWYRYLVFCYYIPNIFFLYSFFFFVNYWQFLLLYTNTLPSHNDSGIKILVMTQFLPLFLPCPHTYSCKVSKYFNYFYEIILKYIPLVLAVLSFYSLTPSGSSSGLPQCGIPPGNCSWQLLFPNVLTSALSSVFVLPCTHLWLGVTLFLYSCWSICFFPPFNWKPLFMSLISAQCLVLNIYLMSKGKRYPCDLIILCWKILLWISFTHRILPNSYARRCNSL